MRAIWTNILIFFFLLLSCSHETIILTDQTGPVPDQKAYDFRPMSEKFFSRCESDIMRSTEIIGEKELISTLSHLNKMNSGGRKYYLLEKDNISEMLNRLSSYKYSESLIINNKGKIIYTMNSDLLLGKSVKSAAEQIQNAYNKSIIGQNTIEDLDISSLAPASYDIYFSSPVYEKNEICGVLISQVSIINLVEQFPVKDTFIVSSDGEYRYKTGFESIDLIPNFNLNKNKIEQIAPDIFTSEGLSYMPFSYKNIKWCIITRKSQNISCNNGLSGLHLRIIRYPHNEGSFSGIPDLFI